MNLHSQITKLERAIEAFKTAANMGLFGKASGNRLQSKVNKFVFSLGDSGREATKSIKDWLSSDDEWKRLYAALVIVSAARDQSVPEEELALETLVDLEDSTDFPVASNAAITLLSIGLNLLGQSRQGGTRVLPWQAMPGKVATAIKVEMSKFYGEK